MNNRTLPSIGGSDSACSATSTSAQYETYTMACQARGVLPCSFEAFAADEARACPVTEAGIPALVATGARGVQGQGGREGGHLIQAKPPESRMNNGAAAGPVVGADSDDNCRRARIEAKWRLRAWQREYGPYQLSHTLHDIGMAAWLFEKLRVEAATLSDQKTPAMRARLLRKLALVELVIAQAARELADVLNTTLWLYRRLPQAYGNPPFVDQAILKMAERLGLDDVPEAIKERATLAANSSVGDAP